MGLFGGLIGSKKTHVEISRIDGDPLEDLAKSSDSRRSARVVKATGGKNVFQRLTENMSFKEVMADERSYNPFLKHCSMTSADKPLVLWKSIQAFRLKFESSSSEERCKFAQEKIDQCFGDKVVAEVVPEKLLKEIKDSVSMGNVDLKLFDSIEDPLFQRLEGVEFHGFKKSKFCRQYFGTSISLGNVIDDDHAMLYFEKFLANEYSSENIDFFEAVKRYQKIWDISKPDNNLEEATYIVRLFISQEAPLQVNIPAKMRVRIEKKLVRDNSSPLVFQQAQEEIYLLMKRDGWPRFRRSKLWDEFLDSVPEVDEADILTTDYIRRQAFLEFLGDDSMDVVFRSKVGRDCFGKFLNVLKANDGTMDFWFDVEQFRQNVDAGPMELQMIAQSIFIKYLDNNAPFPVKIPSSMTKALSDACDKNVQNKMFDNAVIEMKRDLQARDCFSRFKSTGLYTKYRLLAGNSSS